MAVYLDDQAVALPGESLGAVLRSATEQMQRDGRIVVEVQVDGRPLSGEQIAEQSAAAVAGAEVRLYSADPAALAVDALEQVRTRLAGVRQAQQQAAEAFQQDRGNDALARLGEAIDGWLRSQEAVTMAADLVGIDLVTLDVDGRPGAELMTGLIEGLQGLKDAVVRGDTVQLADALAYEWPTLVDAWDRLIESLVDRIEAG